MKHGPGFKARCSMFSRGTSHETGDVEHGPGLRESGGHESGSRVEGEGEGESGIRNGSKGTRPSIFQESGNILRKSIALSPIRAFLGPSKNQDLRRHNFENPKQDL